jgi:glycosyltransferase involved in cell wall biosynthesis
VLTSDGVLHFGPAYAGAFPVHYLPSLRIFGEFVLDPWTLWRRLREAPPTILWTNQPSLTADFGAIFALLNGIPWVATYHGDLMAGRWYARVYTWWEGFLLRKATTVLVHAETYRARLVARGVRAERVLAVTPGPGIGHGRPPAVRGTGCPPDAAPGPDHPFLFVGGLDTPRAYKRPERLLLAMKNLKEAGLVVSAWVAGDGDRRAGLEHLARSFGLKDQVRFLGRESDQSLAEHYHEAWALVLPSTATEGFGLVTLEAIHYGCPVIAADTAGAAPLLAKAGCAIVYADSESRSLERAMEMIWTDPELRRRLATRAKEAATTLGWDQALPRLTAAILSTDGAKFPHAPTELQSSERSRRGLG